ncbi:MAG TPA: nuclear transport factor 2 family protein [Actinomycetes bacterium]
MTGGTPTSVTADGTQTAVAADPRELVERVHRLAAAYDLRGQADLYARDGVLEWPFAPAGVPRRIEGRERIREVLASLEGAVRRAATRVTAVRTTAVHQTPDPEVVIVELEVAGELTTTGATYQLPYIQVFRIRDGQILLFRDYFGPGTAAALETAFAAAGATGQLPRT